MVAMMGLATAVGGGVSLLLVGAGARPDELIPSLVTGCTVALLVAGLASLWSWYGGASAILGFAGAREISAADDRELFNVVDEVRIAAGLPMPRVYRIEDSAMNAFATGRDPQHACVAITSGLREKLTRDELQAVLAHEVAHVRHLDIRFGMLMATMAGLIAFTCDALLRSLRHAPRSRDRDRRGGGGANALLWLLALALLILAPFVARLVQLAYSRQREYLADAGGVELTRNPEALASALQKLGGDTEPFVDGANRGTAHLYIVNPLERVRRTQHELNSFLSSHPPLRDRIARLLALTR